MTLPSPIHLACQSLNASQISQILSENPNLIHAKNAYGGSLLHEICQRRGDEDAQLQCLAELLSHGAKANVQNNGHETPLHYAAYAGNDKLVRALLKEASADPNMRNLDGATPLHYASERGHMQCVAELLLHDTDTTLMDNRGKSALDYAKRKNVQDVAMILRQKWKTDKSARKRLLQRKSSTSSSQKSEGKNSSSGGVPGEEDSLHSEDASREEQSRPTTASSISTESFSMRYVHLDTSDILFADGDSVFAGESDLGAISSPPISRSTSPRASSVFHSCTSLENLTLTKCLRGRTHEATCSSSSTPVAAKVAPYSSAFQQEWELVSCLRHVNVVRAMDYYRDLDGQRMAYTMELMDEDLRMRFNRMRVGFDLHTVIGIGLKVAKGVGYLHDQGYILGDDLRPENILLQGDEVKVLCSSARTSRETSADVHAFGVLMEELIGKVASGVPEKLRRLIMTCKSGSKLLRPSMAEIRVKLERLHAS